MEASAQLSLQQLHLLLLLVLLLLLTLTRRCGEDEKCIMAAANATYNAIYNYIHTHQNSTAIAVFVYSAFVFPNAQAPLPFPVYYNLFFNTTMDDNARSALEAKLSIDCAILRSRGGTGARCSASTRSYPSVPDRVSKCAESFCSFS
jgi:hypothetical protein